MHGRGWSTWEREVEVPGRGGLEYLGEGGRVEYTRMNPPPPPTATAMISFVASKCEISARRSEDGKRNYTGYKKGIIGTWGGSYLKKRTHGLQRASSINKLKKTGYIPKNKNKNGRLLTPPLDLIPDFRSSLGSGVLEFRVLFVSN